MLLDLAQACPADLDMLEGVVVLDQPAGVVRECPNQRIPLGRLIELVDAPGEALTDSLIRTMKQMQKERPEREVRVAWLKEHHGELVSSESIVRARALTEQEGVALYGRRR